MTKTKSPSPTPPLCKTCRKAHGPHRVMSADDFDPICDGCLRAWQRARKAKGAEVSA